MRGAPGVWGKKKGEEGEAHVGTAGAVLLLGCCWSVGVGGSSRSRTVFSVEMMRRVAMAE